MGERERHREIERDVFSSASVHITGFRDA